MRAGDGGDGGEVTIIDVDGLEEVEVIIDREDDVGQYDILESALALASPFSPNDLNLIRDAWHGKGDDADKLVFSLKFGDAMFITRKSFRLIRDGEWLTDESINFRLKQLQAHNDAAVAAQRVASNFYTVGDHNVPATRYLSSFFFSQLVGLDEDG